MSIAVIPSACIVYSGIDPDDVDVLFDMVPFCANAAAAKLVIATNDWHENRIVKAQAC